MGASGSGAGRRGAGRRVMMTKGTRLRLVLTLALTAAVAAVLAAVAPAAAALPPKQDAARDYGGGKRAVPAVLGGIRHSPLDAFVRETVRPRLPAVFALPSSYDLRTQSRLSPVRDQNPYGTCWAFATYSSLESCLLPGETRDFSENNLVWFSGFDREPYNGGGNYWMSTAYLVRWDGPVAEADDAYGSGTHPKPATLSKAKHVQEVLILPSKQGASCDAIKQAIMTHGAVATTMYAGAIASYMKGDAYYYPTTEGQNPDHGVAIVGWDDAYPAGNFLTPPPGNGAFIVRNSWGSGWGSNGYFYASYYDKHIGVSAWCFSGVEPPANYDDIYQYDPLGCVTSYGYGTRTMWLANAFTATASGSIDAVSIYTLYTGIAYQVLAGTTPQTMTARGSGTLTDAGYHTISLSTPLPVARGQSFAVGVKLTGGSSGDTYLIPTEMPYAGYSMAAEASPGQSFFSLDGSTWYDATDEIHSEANICLKAFATEDAPAADPAISSVQPSSGAAGDSVRITGTDFGTMGTVRFGTVAASTSSWTATAVDCAVPNGLPPGEVMVTVASGGKTSNGVAFTVLGEGTDVTPPSTSMHSADDLARWHNHDVALTFEVTDTESGPDALLYSLDAVDWVEMDLALYDTLVVPADPDHSWDGDWTLYFKARDKAGLVEAQQTTSIKIDTRRPVGKAIAAVTVRRGRYATLKYKIAETGPHGPKATGVKVTIKDRRGKVVRAFSLGTKAVNKVHALRFRCTLPRGSYTFFVNGTDAAGNAARVGARRLTVE